MRKHLFNVFVILLITLVGVVYAAREFGKVRVKTLIVRATSTFSGVATHGANVVSDTDATDNLGTTSVRWNAVYADELFWDKGDTVASATTSFTLGSDGNYYVVSGTAQIDSIAAQTAGKFVVLQTAAACTLVDGGNLKLAGNLNATADDIIALISDGTNWHEVSRSAN